MPTAVVEVDLHSGATLRMKQGFNAARAAYADQGQDEKLRPMAEAVLPKAQIDALFRACAPWTSSGTSATSWR